MTTSTGILDSESVLCGIAPVEAVLFDIDGTLCDSDPIHFAAFRQTLQEDFYIENISGKHNDDIGRLLFPDDIERGMKLTDDKEVLFRRLRKWVEDRGLKRAAVTNSPRPNVELMISCLGLSDFFQAVILGCECEHAKPHPEPYLKGLEAIKASKDHTFIFEDSVSGIKAGVAAGMPVIGLTTGNPEHMLLEAKPSLFIKNYDDPKLWQALEEPDKKSSTSGLKE